jgi:hypothetical protein
MDEYVYPNEERVIAEHEQLAKVLAARPGHYRASDSHPALHCR